MLGLHWFRRGDRGSDEPEDLYDDLDPGIEPLRSVTLGGESGVWDRSGGQQKSPDRPRKAPKPRRVAPAAAEPREPAGYSGQSEYSAGYSGDYPSGTSSDWISSDSVRRPGRGGGLRSRLPRGRVLYTIFAVIILPAVTVMFVIREQAHYNTADNGGDPANPPSAVVTGLAPSFFDLTPLPTDNTGPAPVPTPTATQPAGPPTQPAPTRTASPRPVVVQMSLNGLRPAVFANGPSGQKVASVIGLQRFPDSTSVFVSCSVQPATLTYQLGGGFTRFAATAGLTGDATPGNLVARITIIGDGRVLFTAMVSLDMPTSFAVNLAGVKTMVVAAAKVTGTCRDTNQPFGVLGSPQLTRRR
jgi:hypothetical protein